MTSVLPWSAGVLPSPNCVAHRLVAEILLPDRRALHVEGVDAARLERRDHVRAVGDDRRRRPRAPLLVAALRAARPPGRRAPRRPCPSLRSIAMHDVLVRPRRLAARRACASASLTPTGTAVEQEEAIAPDDRRRRSRGRGSPSSSGCSSSRSTRAGGLAVRETPVPSGPRHCGQ